MLRKRISDGIELKATAGGEIEGYANVSGVRDRQNEIVVGSALSLIAGLGDLMPPTALAGLFAAQVVGVDNYFKVLKVCLLPAVVTAVWGILIILGANWYPF